ncbi:MAG: hypothetical protein AAF664_17175 [Planctomycetota bacterium]
MAITAPQLLPILWVPPPTASMGVGTASWSTHRGAGSIDQPAAFTMNVPWHRFEPLIGLTIAEAFAESGVVVNGTRRDFSATAFGFDEFPMLSTNRMISMHPDRWHLTAEDFEDCGWIVLRLDTSSENSWHDPDRLRHHAGDRLPEGYLERGEFNGFPEAPSIDALPAKFEQLSSLSPNAKKVLAIAPHRMDVELRAVLALDVDAIILNLRGLKADPLAVAAAVSRARSWIQQTRPEVNLWIDAAMADADDLAKLRTLGAEAICVDTWVTETLEAMTTEIQVNKEWLIRSGMGSNQSATALQLAREMLADTCKSSLARVYARRPIPQSIAKPLAAADPRWAEALSLPHLTFIAGNRED